MKYEETPVKKSKLSKQQVAQASMNGLSTSTILWTLIKRHKYGLVCTYAVILTVLYLMPFVPDMIFSLF
jgi:hypothetical protein